MRIIELRNQHIQVRKLEDVPGGAGVDLWEIMLVDKATQDVHLVRFGKDARDDIVRQLTGGIVLAGGELPKIH